MWPVLTAGGRSTITASRTSASVAAASAMVTPTCVTPKTPQTPSGETRSPAPPPRRPARGWGAWFMAGSGRHLGGSISHVQGEVPRDGCPAVSSRGAVVWTPASCPSHSRGSPGPCRESRREAVGLRLHVPVLWAARGAHATPSLSTAHPLLSPPRPPLPTTSGPRPRGWGMRGCPAQRWQQTPGHRGP